MGRVLDPTVAINGDLLRSLSKADLRLARLEMQWDRRDTGHLWITAALTWQRIWRGVIARRRAKKRAKARNLRRKAIIEIEKAQNSQGTDALEALDRAREADPYCDEILFIRCLRLYEDFANYAQARQVLINVKNKKDPRFLILAGRCDLALKQFDVAIDELSILIEEFEPHISHDDKNNISSLISCADDSTTTSAAEARADNYINPQQFQVMSDSIFSSAHFLRGHARAATGDWLGAQHDFFLYLSSLPHVERKHTSARTGSTDEERRAWKRRADALQAYGLAAAANENYNLAVSALTESTILFPSPVTLSLLARIHCCERQWTLAEARYRDALNIDPKSQQALVGLEQATIKHEPMPLLSDI
mmetsp:Transcript_11886/g.17801  ORF Transcript_11886/g.17801 Transcript_11886/m.17801 type:complete len:364 (-) Transcript_11886:80-1171(-)